MKTIALTTGKTVEVISAYAAPATPINAVVESPGWNVVGAFRVPVSAKGRLEIVGIVSDADLVMTARLYDLTAVEVVGGSIAQVDGETTDTFARSGVFEFIGGHVYQVQAEVVGDVSDGYGVLKSAQVNS